MHIRFPAPLENGNLVAITAPSTGVISALHPRLEYAESALRDQGFHVVEGQCLRHNYKNVSADKQQRANELMAFLTDPTIHAVMPPWGGELAIELLALLDFAQLAQSPAKWFSGYSDLSTLHIPLTLLAGWATLHGPNLMDLAGSAPDSTTATIYSVLTSSRGTSVTQHSSAHYQITEADWITQPTANFNLNQATQWKRLDQPHQAASFSGRLIGGCLDTLSRLAGTQFADIPKFCDEFATDGVILYFENAEMRPCEFTRTLISLRMQGWFEQLRGVLIGRSSATIETDNTRQNYQDALHSALSGLSMPIIYDVDIGHLPPQLSLVNGAFAQVTFANAAGAITQQL